MAIDLETAEKFLAEKAASLNCYHNGDMELQWWENGDPDRERFYTGKGILEVVEKAMKDE